MSGRVPALGEPTAEMCVDFPELRNAAIILPFTAITYILLVDYYVVHFKDCDLHTTDADNSYKHHMCTSTDLAGPIDDDCCRHWPLTHKRSGPRTAVRLRTDRAPAS